jgi:hypothetical protein
MLSLNCGLDPELLAMSNGFIVPGELFVPPPIRDKRTGEWNSLSYDNAAVEMRPYHTTSTAKLVKGTTYLLRRANQYLQHAIEGGTVPSDTKFSFAPASMLDNEGASLKSVTTFGCSPSQMVKPDYSTMDIAPSAVAAETRIRSAGFHVHSELVDPLSGQAAVALLDATLGLTDVVMNRQNGWCEASRMRRQELGYGRAGEHRIRIVATGKTVLEYRSLSPWPIAHGNTMAWAIDTMRSVCALNTDRLMSTLNRIPARNHIMDAINDSDAVSAKALLSLVKPIWDEVRSTNAQQ